MPWTTEPPLVRGVRLRAGAWGSTSPEAGRCIPGISMPPRRSSAAPCSTSCASGRGDLPLNEGLLAEVEIVIPGGFLNPDFPDDPAACPAVVGGNVETSQRVVDLLLIGLGLQANSQGTMNNLLFGNERFGYYETIGGGGGAGPGRRRARRTHVHMSNTAITDPEILERRYPGAPARVLAASRVGRGRGTPRRRRPGAGGRVPCAPHRSRCSPSAARSHPGGSKAARVARRASKPSAKPTASRRPSHPSPPYQCSPDASSASKHWAAAVGERLRRSD